MIKLFNVFILLDLIKITVFMVWFSTKSPCKKHVIYTPVSTQVLRKKLGIKTTLHFLRSILHCQGPFPKDCKTLLR